jgi:hypothetical protein
MGKNYKATNELLNEVEEFNKENDSKLKYFKGFVVGLLVGTAIVMASVFITMFTSPIPTAIDVYRGKTDLEITYRNGEIVDSTVVFKVKK